MAQFVRAIMGIVIFAGLGFAAFLGFAAHRFSPAEKPSDLASFTQTLRTAFEGKKATETVYGRLPEDIDTGLSATNDAKAQAPAQPTVHVVLPNYVDPTALDKIRAMQIPDEMKERIIKTALRTGQVPVLSEPEASPNARAPAQAK